MCFQYLKLQRCSFALISSAVLFCGSTSHFTTLSSIITCLPISFSKGPVSKLLGCYKSLSYVSSLKHLPLCFSLGRGLINVSYQKGLFNAHRIPFWVTNVGI